MAILSFSGDIELFTGDFFGLGSLSRSTKLRALNERQNISLTRNIKIAKSNPLYVELDGVFANFNPPNFTNNDLAYDWDADFGTLPELAAGTIVDSHFIAFFAPSGNGRTDAAATITFDAPIVGFIDSRDSDLTNDLFSFTTYSTPAGATLEGLSWGWNVPSREFRDYVKVLGENNNILELRWSTNAAYEGLRVLTLASSDIPQNPDPTPEPDPVPNTSINIDIGGTETDFTLSSYASTSQDLNGQYTISTDKNQLNLSGNTWKKLDIGNYAITANTVLEFEFQSTNQGEIHAIGFDTDEKLSPNFSFQLSGTQNWGMADYKKYTTGSGWQSYTINVGDYFTGNFNYLTFANDHDVADPNGSGQFRNLKLYESSPDPTPVPDPAGQTITGTSVSDVLTGTSGNDTLNGKAGADNLSGLEGADTFIFQFGESPATKSGADTIQDFVMGLDKIDLLTQGGQALSAPVNFTRAADATVWNVATIVNSVFADANGALAGNQPLGVNSAALIKGLGNSSYLVINDGVPGLQAQNDILIRLNNLSGAWPSFGAIAVEQFFV